MLLGGEVGESRDIFKDESVCSARVTEALRKDLIALHAPDGVFCDDAAG